MPRLHKCLIFCTLKAHNEVLLHNPGLTYIANSQSEQIGLSAGDELREGIFEKLFAVAEIARFSTEEVQAYEDSLKSYRDLKNTLDTACEE